MTEPHTSPSTKLFAFNCPQCRAYAKVAWYQMGKAAIVLMNGAPIGGTRPAKPSDDKRMVGGSYAAEPQFCISTCSHCHKSLIWLGGEIVYPRVELTGPPPAEDMPADIVKDYEEARFIAAKSARGAAAILRLCLQKICVALGEKGENINTDIGRLVAKGLAPEVQEALDTVRVFGNNAVHPGELDIRDEPDDVEALMKLLNFIIEAMITEPKKRKALFGKLPQGAKAAIAKRDNP